MNALKQLGAEKKEIVDKVYLLKFDDQVNMAKTFLRFQEHYENPHFNGKVFSLKEFKAWYINNHGKGKFSYYKDWGGFNFPSYILDPFYNGEFKNLTKRERLLLDVFSKEGSRPFYIIGAADEHTIRHEAAHGLFYTNAGYKARVLWLIKGKALLLRKALRNNMYCDAVIDDEVNAYLIECDDNGAFDLDFKRYSKLAIQLNDLFLEYYR